MCGKQNFLVYGWFFCYNQIQIKPNDQHKIAFIYPWGAFAYQKIPFSNKNIESFQDLNKALVLAPLLHPSDYSRDFFIYIVVSQEMVSMVLVQEDDELHEHIIYCFSQNIIRYELKYSHVEKLALETFHVV